MPADAAPRPGGTLAGRIILVTRPKHQVGPLRRLIADRGGRAIEFPLLRIVPAGDAVARRRRLSILERSSLVVFVSANAVNECRRLAPDLVRRLAGVTVAALGGGTRRALAEAGLAEAVVTPAESTTEDLLAHPAFDPAKLAGRRVVIVKGQGGRGLMSQVLRARGARVIPIVVYRRAGPSGDFRQLLAEHGDEVSAAVVTSASALGHLRRLTPRDWRGRVLAWPLALPSERVVRRARELGFTGCLEATRTMSDEAMVEALEALLAMGTPGSTTMRGRGGVR